MAIAFDFQRAFESVHERLDDISNDQAEARTHLKNLLGNGQPGRMTIVEAEVDDLKRWRDGAKGYLAGAVAVIILLGWLGHFAIDYFLHK